MILVTGANGFIGKHLLIGISEIFKKKEILLLTSQKVKGYQCILYKNYSFSKNVQTKLNSYNFEIVFHAGAYTPKNNTDATDYFLCNENIFFTSNLLKNLNNVKKFIFLSTLDVYKNTKEALTEESEILPVSLYGYSKLYCEKLIDKWASDKNICIQILRIGHVYGPGEEAYNKFIPTVIRKAINNEKIQIYGDGLELRSFIYITDVVSCIISSSFLPVSKGIINICSGHSSSLLEIINSISKLLQQPIHFEKLEQKTEKRDIIFLNEKMKNLLCLEKVSLTEGLKLEIIYMQKLVS